MNYKRIIVISIVCVIVTLATVGLFNILHHEEPPTPVEKINTIAPLLNTNDTIKVKVKHLDSIKNEQVRKVVTLDYDSTINLFYKLVSE